jgi:putative Ca2+/H+ antiporter (TMEM165/GDT1 family)
VSALAPALYGFLVVALVIGGLELFDRTSFALIALASRAHGFGTWAGGALAFVVTTGFAVALGAALASLFGPSHVGLLRVGGGVFLIGYALWVYFRHEPEVKRTVGTVHTAFAAAFVAILLLELGDTTMIFEIVFVANFGWAVVLAAGALALVAVAAWDVWLGRTLGNRVEPAQLERIVVVVLVAVGAFTIAYGLYPAAFPSL